jgi:hypothetical protein
VPARKRQNGSPAAGSASDGRLPGGGDVADGDGGLPAANISAFFHDAAFSIERRMAIYR